MAIGFIFEIDDMMYAMVLGRNARHEYENTPPVAGTCLAVPGSPRVAEWYTWLLVIGDFVIAYLAYAKFAFGYDWDDHPYAFFGLWQIASLIWIRAAVLAVATTHLASRARAHKLREHARRLSGSFKGLGSLGTKAPKSADGDEDKQGMPTNWGTCGRQAFRLSFEFGRLVLSAGLVVGLSAFVTKICYQYAVIHLSFDVYCIHPDSELATCMNSWTKSAECSYANLNASGPAGIMQMDYSYEDEFWSMMDFGPSRVGCLRPSLSLRFDHRHPNHHAVRHG